MYSWILRVHLLPVTSHQFDVAFHLPLPDSHEAAVVLFICRHTHLPEESMSAEFTTHDIITAVRAARFLRAKDWVHGEVLLL